MVELLAFIGIVVVLFWLLRGGGEKNGVRRDNGVDAVRPLDASWPYYDPTREEYVRNLSELLEGE